MQSWWCGRFLQIDNLFGPRSDPTSSVYPRFGFLSSESGWQVLSSSESLEWWSISSEFGSFLRRVTKVIETEDSPSSNYSAGQRTSSKFPFLHFAEEYQGSRLVSNKLFFCNLWNSGLYEGTKLSFYRLVSICDVINFSNPDLREIKHIDLLSLCLCLICKYSEFVENSIML